MTNPLTKDFWENRYQTQQTGWDLGHISAPLKKIISGFQNKNFKILIPGCGNAYEGDYLIENGFHSVTLLDIAPSAIKNTKDKMQHAQQVRFICDDFFNHHDQYDLILEQTFFCALDPKIRAAYAKHMAELLKPHGILTGVLFSFPLTSEGPPFGGSQEEYLNYFEPYFKVLKMIPCEHSEPSRQGRELLFEFQKL